jgi:hypothetical protein|tara:strand:+ start:1436 stop:1654 length:219 start_codon:yes stop_codon:yes gene_type:complete
MKNFLLLRNTNDKVISLNPLHIISVKPFIVKNYKVGSSDTIVTKIESIGAMVSSELVYESVEVVNSLITESL